MGYIFHSKLVSLTSLVNYIQSILYNTNNLIYHKTKQYCQVYYSRRISRQLSGNETIEQNHHNTK